MKIYGSLFAQAGDDEQPFVFLPADGSKSEFATIAQVPDDVKALLTSQGDSLSLLPLGVIVDLG